MNETFFIGVMVFGFALAVGALIWAYRESAGRERAGVLESDANGEEVSENRENNEGGASGVSSENGESGESGANGVNGVNRENSVRSENSADDEVGGEPGVAVAIDSAERVIEEINRYSNAILQRLDEKNNEAGAIITELDDRFEKIRRESPAELAKPDQTAASAAADGSGDLANIEADGGASVGGERAFVKNEKYAQVIALSKEGLDAEGIAKKLNIGKGEVLLALGLQKAYG